MILRDVLRSPAQVVTVDDDLEGAWFSQRYSVIANPCGSEPARDCGLAVDIVAGCEIAIASRLAPTGLAGKDSAVFQSLDIRYKKSLIFQQEPDAEASPNGAEAFQQAAQG
ncbi:hypothetical protein PBDP_4701 [Pseudomonas sp. St290]|nr:hypothetical protein PBDP_4701 [Pseudomonas sp. St290]